MPAATNGNISVSSLARWPLMLIGAQKAATSSLFTNLAGHPDFCYTPSLGDEPRRYDKEKHFFDEDERCARSTTHASA